MSTVEYVHQYADTKVHYKTRASSKDRRHLIVMFTGIRPHDQYEFDGASTKDSQANWLWIRDDFDGEHTYYMCQNMDFRIEEAVLNLIESEMERLGLTPDQVTLAGCSKGGAAALYFAIKYQFPNILVGVPQIRVGTYVQETRPKIFAHMTRSNSDTERIELDGLIPNAILNDSLIERNIYIVSSKDDEEFGWQLQPFIHLFKKYANFNLILTDSDLVDEHIEVVRYNIPVFLSIMYLLTDGIMPKIGHVTNGGRALHAETPMSVRRSKPPVPFVDFQSLIVAKERMYPIGVSFCEGYEVSQYVHLRRKLVFTSAAKIHRFPLGALKDKWLTSKYFKDAYCDYRYAKFASIGQKGIDLAQIPRGVYTLTVEMTAHGEAAEPKGGSAHEISQISPIGEDLVRVWSNSSGTYMERRSAIGRKPSSSVFSVVNRWIKDSIVHIEGIFAIEGMEVSKWQDISYFLILRRDNSTIVYSLGTGNKERQVGLFDEDLADYSSAYYATSGYRGISTSNVADGSYELLITASHRNSIFTISTDCFLLMHGGVPTWK